MSDLMSDDTIYFSLLESLQWKPTSGAQRAQQAHGPKVDMTQQPLATLVESISVAQQIQVQTVLVQTPVQKPCSFVKQHLHELAVDIAIWERLEWQGFDRLNKSLEEGCHILGSV
jgi:hypothetical protein